MIADEKILSQFSLFASLSSEDRERVASFCKITRFAKTENIFLKGEEISAFYLLLEGKVAIFILDALGNQQVLHIAEAGQSFAEAAVFSMNEYPASATALNDCKVVSVSKKKMLDFIESNPKACMAIIAGQSLWLRRLVDLTSLLSIKEADVRTARYILEYTIKNKINLYKEPIVEFNVKKSVIAEYIGMLPETFSRSLKKLENESIIIKRQKAIEVLSPERLYKKAYPEV